MSNKVDADSADIRDFASNLKSQNDIIAEALNNLHSRMDALSGSWRDQVHEQFANEFEQTTQNIRRFLQTSEDYIPYLYKKADQLDEFLQR